MFSLFRNRIGIPGIISVIALVFAMIGGAYAANSSPGGATASKAGPRGPRGKTGKAGPAGPVGPVGPAGSQGSAGAKGDTGAPGAPGKDGTSVTNTTVPTSSATCSHLGGAEFKVGAGTPTTACNGEEGPEGPEGPEGSPWTDSGTLPLLATETGTWGISGFTTETFHPEVFAPISFTIPLVAALDASHVHYSTEASFGSTCTGTAANPTAPSGHLCVYQAHEHHTVFVEILRPDFLPGANTVGTMVDIQLIGEVESQGEALGTWAVTG